MNKIKKSEIRQLISKILEKNNDLKPISDDEELITSNRLDSLDVAELMIYLQDEYDINTANSDPDFYEKLNTINAITAYINNNF